MRGEQLEHQGAAVNGRTALTYELKRAWSGPRSTTTGRSSRAAASRIDLGSQFIRRRESFIQASLFHDLGYPVTESSPGMSVDYKLHPILFVDDEPQNQVVFRYAMEDHFTILTASSGLEALEILQREPIAVLLADQRMPVMGGAELCARAREVRPKRFASSSQRMQTCTRRLRRSTKVRSAVI